MNGAESGYRIVIDFIPGKGFVFSASTPHEHVTCPSVYATLNAAFRRIEKSMKADGFVTVLPGWEECGDGRP